MKNKYFGTDGIRGTVNKGNITGEKFFKFGLASGNYFKNQKKTKQVAIIAKDTRLSGYTLEPALVSGLVSGGMHVFTLGPLPTNGLAMLTKSMKANMGIMITASHNPYYDNGLKLFGPDGLKLSDKIEQKIEKLIDSKIIKNLAKPEILGRVKRLENGNNKYIDILKKNFPQRFSLKGIKIAIDGYGRTFKFAIACSDRFLGLDDLFFDRIKWVAEFSTEHIGTSIVHIPFSKFIPTIRTKKVSLKAPLRKSAIAQFQIAS